MQKHSIKANSRDKLIVYILALLSYVPLTTTGNIIRIFVVGILYILKASRSNVDFRVRKISHLIMISPFVPLIFVLLIDHTFSTGLLIHETMRMVYCALIILVASTLNVDFQCIYTATLLVFLPNFAIQFCQYRHISSVTAFIRQYYVTAESDEFTHLDLTLSTGADFRAGSIFINPNVYMVIPLLSLVVFLQKDYRDGGFINRVFIIFAAISCYLCGSRTATVVLAFILGLYILRYAKGSSRGMMILLILAGVYTIVRNGMSSSRALQLGIEDSGSLQAKFRGFRWFWSSTMNRPIYWITGSLGAPNVSGIDCEWGHLYSWYGLFGLNWYIKYNRLAMHWNEHIVFYSRPMTYACILCAITASVMLCMPIYSFVVIMLFAKISD